MKNNLESTKTYATVATGANTQTSTILDVDTLGFSYASIDIVQPAGGNTAQPFSVLRVEHSDTFSTGTSGYSAVSVGGTDFALPAGGVNAGLSVTAQVIRLNVALEGKQRFLRVRGQPGINGSIVSVCRLAVSEDGVANASDANVLSFTSVP